MFPFPLSARKIGSRFLAVWVLMQTRVNHFLHCSRSPNLGQRWRESSPRIPFFLWSKQRNYMSENPTQTFTNILNKICSKTIHWWIVSSLPEPLELANQHFYCTSSFNFLLKPLAIVLSSFFIQKNGMPSGAQPLYVSEIVKISNPFSAYLTHGTWRIAPRNL